jgi:hypothetical protein
MHKLAEIKNADIMTTLISLMLVLFLTIINVFQRHESGSDILLIKKSDDFEISGKGTSLNWDRTDWINIPQRTERSDTYDTRAKVLYSENGIYFLFYCEDKILTATLNEDNLKLWEEDVIEVFLWTDESYPLYFEYQISPLNFQLTILVPNFDGNFLGWLPWMYEGDRQTRHETSVTGGEKESGSYVDAWMAEFYIPYKLLRPLNNVPPASGTRWRANMYRIDHDQGITRFSWQDTGRNFHDYNRFGTFHFE